MKLKQVLYAAVIVAVIITATLLFAGAFTKLAVLAAG